MAVLIGDVAQASAYNTLKSGINLWFGDSDPSMVFGAVNQTYGWGGTVPVNILTGELIEAVEYNPLIDICNLGTGIITSVSGDLSQVANPGLISASEYNNVETKSSSLSSGRFNIDSGELSLHAGTSDARTTNWSAAINCVFRYSFSNFAEARYFFNSGGALNISGTITGYSEGAGWDGAGFNGIFTNMGTVTMDYTQTTQSGIGGTTTAIGYYDLTTAWQQIFSMDGAVSPYVYTYPYQDTYLNIYARYQGLGALVDIYVILTPGVGRTVDGTTTITSQYRKLDDQTSGSQSLSITAPSASVTNTLE